MFKLLIVDDEKQVRETLCQLIAWDALGVGPVETARNGMAALELLGDFKPDIVICDVRMPKMDGMTFAGHLRTLLPECRLIFISGYADKENMKSAIRLQAVNFVEKPIDLAEIEGAVRQAVAELRRLEAGRVQQRRQAALVQENYPAILEQAVLGLINPESDAARERKRLERAGCRLLEEPPFLAATIQLEWDGLMEAEERAALRKAILMQLNRQSERRHGGSAQGSHAAGASGQPAPGSHAAGGPAQTGAAWGGRMAGFCSDERLALVLAGIGREDAGRVVAQLLGELEAIRPGRVSALAGIGMPAQTAEELPEGYRQSVAAARQLFYRKDERVLAFDRMEPETAFQPPADLLASFRDHLARNDLGSAESLAAALSVQAQACRDGDVNHVKNAYFSLAVIALESAFKGRTDPFVRQADQPYVWSRFGRMSRLADMDAFLLDLIRSRLKQEESGDQKLVAIQHYVQQHFHRPDLSLQDVADAVHLSQSYLCSFFKKATGRTLLEYTTGLRIEKAKALLRDEQMRLYTVAEMTGFGDANYFSTIFKKVTGMTPSEHRERQRG